MGEKKAKYCSITAASILALNAARYEAICKPTMTTVFPVERRDEDGEITYEMITTTVEEKEDGPLLKVNTCYLIYCVCVCVRERKREKER